MVNPDAAACAMIAAAITPLAGNNAELHLSLATALTLLTGLFCIAASYFRLGALADFLSRPILVGFLNGIAISIFLGQIGKLLGFSVDSSGIIPRLLEVLEKLPLVHGATLAVGLGSFALLFACLRWLPRLPAALVVLVVAGAAAAGLGLDAQGVAVLGPVPAGLPPLRWPTVPLHDCPALAADADGRALVGVNGGELCGEGWLPDRRRPRVCRLRGSQYLLRAITGLCRNRRGLAHGSRRCRRRTHAGDRAGRSGNHRNRAPVPDRTAAICAGRRFGSSADLRRTLAVRRWHAARTLEVRSSRGWIVVDHDTGCGGRGRDQRDSDRGGACACTIRQTGRPTSRRGAGQGGRPAWLSFDRTARNCRKNLSGAGAVPLQRAADILQRRLF